MDYRYLSVLLATLIALPTVAALGVNTPFWDDYPLRMYPGQTQEVLFNLQNCPSRAPTCDQGTVQAYVTISGGSDIASIRGTKTFTLPFGSSTTNIPVIVTIPEIMNEGETRQVELTITSSPPSNEGPVQVGVAYTVSFPVAVGAEAQATEIVQPDTETPQRNAIWWVLGILVFIVILLAFWVVKVKKR